MCVPTDEKHWVSLFKGFMTRQGCKHNNTDEKHGRGISVHEYGISVYALGSYGC